MTALRAIIDKAGKYPVVQAPCPCFQHELADLTVPAAGVLHTTEGGWNGSMDVFKVHYAPHFALGLNASGKPEIAQLVPVGIIGAACVGHNNKARVQIEMIGYAKEEAWLPDDDTLDVLASLMLVCRDEWGIPLSHPWSDGDYGRAGDNPHRHSGKFGTVAGWFGHADMPPMDSHWDPGNLQWSKVFAHAASIDRSAVPAPSTPTMSTTALQTALNALGADPQLDVDGDFGPRTKAELFSFQVRSNLAGTGQLSSATIAALEHAVAGRVG